MGSFSTLMGRNNAYSPSYALQRGTGLPLTTMNDIPRGSHYTATPRALEISYDRTQNTLFQHMPEPTPRSQPHVDAQPTPPFEPTEILENIVAEIGNTRTKVRPEVFAKMGRGFFPFENNWTCYRRNYFQVTCSWSLSPYIPQIQPYLVGEDGQLKPIRQFAMGISAIVNGSYRETRELVQHTAKRDKQSEKTPGRVALQPSTSNSLSGDSTGNGNHSNYAHGSQSMEYSPSYTGAAQPCQPPTQHTFLRIQFQKATANNGKRRAQQQTYNVVVELHAGIDSPKPDELQWVVIARRMSSPMVVRGRSPSHYKDGRRDSTASMGPDGGSGDGSGGSLPPSMARATRSHHPLMYDSAHRGGLSYGRTDYKHMPAEHSPLSDSPLISSSSSSGFDYTMVNDTMDPMDTLKNDSSLDAYHDPLFAGVPSHQQRQQNPGGYDPVYSTYARYDHPQHLCT